MVSALARARPRNSAFWITTRAWKSAACVNRYAEHTSPAAKIRRLLVRSRSSTVTPARGSHATPARSRPRPSTLGSPADRDEDARPPRHRARLVPDEQAQHGRPVAPLDALDAAPQHEADPVAREGPLHVQRRVAIVLAAAPVAPLEQRTSRAEPGERLGQLAPDGTGADHGQATAAAR